jgi:hypothetical protein
MLLNGNPSNPDNGGHRAVGTVQPRRPGPVGVGWETRLRQDGQPKGQLTGSGNRQAFEADVITRLALEQTIACQDNLATAHGVHKGVVSKWLKDTRKRRLIPAALRAAQRETA